MYQQKNQQIISCHSSSCFRALSPERKVVASNHRKLNPVSPESCVISREIPDIFSPFPTEYPANSTSPPSPPRLERTPVQYDFLCIDDEIVSNGLLIPPLETQSRKTPQDYDIMEEKKRVKSTIRLPPRRRFNQRYSFDSTSFE